MKYLAIDPGNVTGVAMLNTYHDPNPYVEEIPGGLVGFINWFERETNWDWDRVFLEDYIIDADTHKKTAQPDAWLLVGWVKGECHRNNQPLSVFGASEHTGFSGYKKKKTSKLVRLGWHNPSKDMHMDSASSILLTGLKRFDKAYAHALLKTIATEA